MGSVLFQAGKQGIPALGYAVGALALQEALNQALEVEILSGVNLQAIRPDAYQPSLEVHTEQGTETIVARWVVVRMEQVQRQSVAGHPL